MVTSTDSDSNKTDLWSLAGKSEIYLWGAEIRAVLVGVVVAELVQLAWAQLAQLQLGVGAQDHDCVGGGHRHRGFIIIMNFLFRTI